MNRRKVTLLSAGAVAMSAAGGTSAQIAQRGGIGGALLLISVKDPPFNAKGDGVTDDTAAITAAINFCFPQSRTRNDLVNALNNRGILYFPPGNYIISRAIQLVGIAGAHILGSGQLTTQITQVTSGYGCFYCNGIAYSVFEGFCFTCSGRGSAGLEIDWDSSVGPNTHANVVRDCFFNGCDIGSPIGASGGQCSEIAYYNNYFANCTTAGIKVLNFNALNIGVYGGDFEGCANYAIWVYQGAAPIISGVAFENGSNVYDIQIDNSGGDSYLISGCRSESTNFLNAPRGLITMSGCRHSGLGTFVKTGFHPITLISCSSGFGPGSGSIINGSGGRQWQVIGCEFGQPLSAMTGTGQVQNSYFNGMQDVGGGTFYGNTFWDGTLVYPMGIVEVGYSGGHGARGTVTQLTSKSTGVSLNAIGGQITMNNAALAPNTPVTFTLTNAYIGSNNNQLILNHISGGTIGAYALNSSGANGSANTINITVTNISGGSLSEVIVIQFSVVHGITN